MGHPLRLRDGSVALLELRPGTKLTAEEEEALCEYVEFLRDKSDTISLARRKLAAPPVMPVNRDFIQGGRHRCAYPGCGRDRDEHDGVDHFFRPPGAA
jgi:hypothetical protein